MSMAIKTVPRRRYHECDGLELYPVLPSGYRADVVNQVLRGHALRHYLSNLFASCCKGSVVSCVKPTSCLQPRINLVHWPDPHNGLAACTKELGSSLAICRYVVIKSF